MCRTNVFSRSPGHYEISSPTTGLHIFTLKNLHSYGTRSMTGLPRLLFSVISNANSSRFNALLPSRAVHSVVDYSPLIFFTSSHLLSSYFQHSALTHHWTIQVVDSYTVSPQHFHVHLDWIMTHSRFRMITAY
jgi:hypothetical protein